MTSKKPSARSAAATATTTSTSTIREAATFDTDLYGRGREELANEVVVGDEDEEANKTDFAMSTGYHLARRMGEEAPANSANDDTASELFSKASRPIAKSAYLAQGTERLYGLTNEASELERLDAEKKELTAKLSQAGHLEAGAETVAAAAAVPVAPPADAKPRRSRWDRPPSAQEDPAPPKRVSRWDQPPAAAPAPLKVPPPPLPVAAPVVAPPSHLPELTDADLDAMLPSEGYEIVAPPPGYESATSARRTDLFAAPSATASAAANSILAGLGPTPSKESYGVDLTPAENENVESQSAATREKLPYIGSQDLQYFAKLVARASPPPGVVVPELHTLPKEEQLELEIMTLLLKIKNGLPPVRKVAMRQITEDAPRLGAGPLLHQILPLLMSPMLDPQERHLLVKTLDRVLYRLGPNVLPHTKKVVAVIEPLLIDDNLYARLEGREILANLSKAVGLEAMIATMRPDIDSPDEFVRNVTARAFAVVASSLGVASLTGFLKAACRSKRSWQARHTGVKIAQQISVLSGCGVLPHLPKLVECVAPCLTDDQQVVRTMTALAIASLAEAAHPYGYESFVPVLDSLWEGVTRHRGMALAAFIKAVGCVIPLMADDNALIYAERVIPVLCREFKTPEDEAKKVILKTLRQVALTPGVTASFLRKEALGPFFEAFWVRRMALDRRNYEQLVDCTVALSTKVGAAEILERLVGDLKDESEPYRRMVMDCVERVLKEMGASDVSIRLEERLVDAALFAFQEQEPDGRDAGSIMLKGFIRIIESLGERSKPYLAQIASAAKWRLQNKVSDVRLQAADLIAGLAPTLRVSDEIELAAHLGVVLFENLGEEFPGVLGSLLKAISAVLASVGVDQMTPPVRDLLPRLTPIFKNTNEKVQEALIELVGRIAQVGPQHASAGEWIRICAELLESLRSPRMSIRRTAVQAFGYIAKAVGPQDVLHALMSNLRVQDRQRRVCTTVAIAIVAETCAPFTVLPGLMNEYRAPDILVQNGVLKAISFMLQYIGPMAVDYVSALAPLLQDALSDRDHVHRQTACDAVKHLALSVAGRGCEDALAHLLNFIWPNVFEGSPHVQRAVFESIEALRVALGPSTIFAHLQVGLFHPARFVRTAYWRLYNNLYVYAGDALVPAFPRLENAPARKRKRAESAEDVDALDLESAYKRTHLELFI